MRDVEVHQGAAPQLLCRANGVLLGVRMGIIRKNIKGLRKELVLELRPKTDVEVQQHV